MIDGENSNAADQPLPPAATPDTAVSPVTAETPLTVEDEVSEIEIELKSDEQPEEQRPGLTPWPSQKRATQEAEVFLPAPAGRKLEDEPISIAIPTTTQKRTEDALGMLPNLDYEKMPGGVDWGNTIAATRYTIQFRDGFRSTVDREGSDFRQVVRSEKGILGASQPRFKESGGGLVTGEKAVLRVQALMGVGSLVSIPLWHSGFWITLKAPGEGALLELNRRLAQEKITLGRMTHGLAFSNNSVFWSAWLMDFAIAHIYDSSLKPEMLEKSGYRERIKSQDLLTIAWGLAAAVWPKGFPYARAIIDPAGGTTKVIREIINVMKLQWVDTASLTPWQISHMASRVSGSMSEETVQRYLDDFTRGKGRRVQLSENIAVMLKVPSVAEYVISGQKWVNNIMQMVDRAFQLPPDSVERNQYIGEQGKATNMRQYSHWIEQIITSNGDEENVVVDVPTIEDALSAMSQSDELRKAYFEGVQQFIEDSTISLIAVPATEETDKSDMPRFPNLLPIDPLSVFFILLVQKTAQIQSRED